MYHTLYGVLLSRVFAEVEQLWLCSVVHLLVGGDVSDILSGTEVDTLHGNTDRAMGYNKSHKIIIKEEELDRANIYKALTVIDEMYALTATCT